MHSVLTVVPHSLLSLAVDDVPVAWIIVRFALDSVFTVLESLCVVSCSVQIVSLSLS